MDDLASQATDLNSYFFRVRNSGLPTSSKHTIIKYTKLPGYDFDSQVLWPRKDTYVLHPRLRRIIQLNDEDDFLISSRSLHSEITTSQRLMSTSSARRKMVTLIKDEDIINSPLATTKKAGASNTKVTSVSSQRPGRSDGKETPNRPTPRRSAPSKYLAIKSDKSSAKANINVKNFNNETKYVKTKTSSQHNRLNVAPTRVQTNDSKIQNLKEKEKSLASESINILSKTTNIVSKKAISEIVNEKEICSIQKHLLAETRKKTDLYKTNSVVTNRNVNRRYVTDNNLNHNLLTNYASKGRNNAQVIQVPLERAGVRRIVETQITHLRVHPGPKNIEVEDSSTEMEQIELKSIKVGTDVSPKKIDVYTEMEKETTDKKNRDSQTDCILKSHFDNLDVPNITLLKNNKSDGPDIRIINLCSQSLPDLQVPAMQIVPHKEDREHAIEKISKSKSFIIGRATLTCTTKQKINFHVVENKDDVVSTTSPKHLAYPLNVVSVLKKEMKKKVANDSLKENDPEKQNTSNFELFNDGSQLQTVNCSHVYNNTKLVKPSELITTIRFNNGLQSDYICEQFQRELNFIDSFFESLHYLESCSMTNKSFTDTSVEHWVTKSGFDVKNPEYNSLFTKFETGPNDDTETMASKSLCLLNLLIRDEKRRAKNLLLVLKMREDALKDFTKSQILWLENKKKQDNTDISTLKKKQRGALLKLQHECGEMQRMRKALVALSEKRKVALMKTKKNIELKLKNNVVVDQILIGKKKLKRNFSNDRLTAPLKCFDLSSSGCEESATGHLKSESALIPTSEILVDYTAKSAEKSIQTGESLIEQVDEATDTTAEHFVTVDGGYLNILFNNLSLPEIFSGGKQYEVNEEALKNILNSANSSNSVLSAGDIVDKFKEQIKNRDQDRSTTPSTARSLVDEFNQYYKGLSEDLESSPESLEQHNTKVTIFEDCTMEPDISIKKNVLTQNTATIFSDSGGEVAHSDALIITDTENSKDVQTLDKETCTSVIAATQAGPLPVPAGAVAETNTVTGSDIPAETPYKTSSEDSISSSLSNQIPYTASSLAALSTPAQCEAEELRRQQLAIEREIKALEQQQCQLLVVREIPDKPPPPYIAPNEIRMPKTPRMFLPDDTIDDKIKKTFSGSCESTDDAFDAFLQDYCQESLEKHMKVRSDKPWDACNLLPQKAPLSQSQMVKKTSDELRDVLKKGVAPTVVSGVSTRRSDHIDDILFAEWRRYEPEWTALHSDEATVKSQIFEGIFQSILSKTVDEYKKILYKNSQLTDDEENIMT